MNFKRSRDISLLSIKAFYMTCLVTLVFSVSRAEVEDDAGPETMAPGVQTPVVETRVQTSEGGAAAAKSEAKPTGSICSQDSILNEINLLKKKEPEALTAAKKKYDDLLRKYAVAKEFEQIFNNYNKTIKEIKESEKDPTSALGKINHLEEVGDQIEFASKIGAGFEKYDPEQGIPTEVGKNYAFIRSQLNYRVNDSVSYQKDHIKDFDKLKKIFKELKLCAADCTPEELNRIDNQKDFLNDYLAHLNTMKDQDIEELKLMVKDFDVKSIERNKEGLQLIKKSLEIFKIKNDNDVLTNLKEVRISKLDTRKVDLVPIEITGFDPLEIQGVNSYTASLREQISNLKIQDIHNPFKGVDYHKNQIIKMYEEKQKKLDNENKEVLKKFSTEVIKKLSSIPDSDTDPYNKFFKDIFKNDSCKKDKKEDSDHQACSDLILDKINALKDGGNWDLEKLKIELDSAKKEIEKLNARPMFGENGKAASYNDSLRNYFAVIRKECGPKGLDNVLKSALNDQQRLSCSLGMCNDTQSFVSPYGSDSGLKELMIDNENIATYIEDKNNEIEGDKARKAIENDCQLSSTFCGKIAQDKAMSKIRSDYVATWVDGVGDTPGQYIYRDKKMGIGGFFGAFAMGGLQNMTQPGGLLQTYMTGYNLDNQMQSIWYTDLYRYQTNQYMLNSYNNMFAIPSYGGNPSGYIPGYSYFQNSNPYLYYNPISN